MSYSEFHPWRFAVLTVTLGLLVACDAGAGSIALATPPEDQALIPVATRLEVPTTTSMPTTRPTPVPPATPTPFPQATPIPTVRPSPTAEPVPTLVEGLPCPPTDPLKPDYSRYTLSAEPWPAPDRTIAPIPFPLADPLPFAARNSGYPYGSDGSGRYLLHNGLDMAHEEDEFAIAPADGLVIVARDDLDEMFGWRCDWYGQLVVMRLDEEWQDEPVFLLFGHVSDVQVEEGQTVKRGDPIAREGTAGVATVPHLHFEVRLGENIFSATQNPLLWIEPWSGSGVIAGRLIDPDGHSWQGVTMTLIDRRGEADFLNTWTYLDDPQHLIRPDRALGENFVFGPVAAGTYDVFTQVQGVDYRQTVEVRDGELIAVEIVTEAYRTPTPAP